MQKCMYTELVCMHHLLDVNITQPKYSNYE